MSPAGVTAEDAGEYTCGLEADPQDAHARVELMVVSEYKHVIPQLRAIRGYRADLRRLDM